MMPGHQAIHYQDVLVFPQVSNILRVPFEQTKQRAQANGHKTALTIVRETIATEVS